MKCDELEIKYVGYGMGFYPTEEVDEAIAELKDEIKRLNQPRALFSNLETMGRLSHEIDELRWKYELAIATIKEYKNDVANLNEQIAVLKHQACKMNCMMVKHYNEVCDDNQRQKYKRCLAQAQRCMDARIETEADAVFFTRWEHRWLTLAEKFKERL